MKRLLGTLSVVSLVACAGEGWDDAAVDEARDAVRDVRSDDSSPASDVVSDGTDGTDGAPPDASDATAVTDATVVTDATDAAVVLDASDAMSAPDATRPVDAAVDAPPPTPTDPVLYPANRAHSPLTASVVERLRAIASTVPGASANVFAKVGDSNTVNTNYLECFAGSMVDLAGRTALQPTIDRFRSGDAAGSDPYRRVSQAATVGWSVGSVIAGSPSPLDQEISAIAPRYATLMFGTNDIQSRNIDRYANDMLTTIDRMIARGVVPLVSSVPPRDDSVDADLWVPRYNAVARALAQARQVPFMDLERQLRPLPDHGIGPDGLHMNTYRTSAGARACVFTAAGLQFGFNTRNLLAIESLDRTRRAVETRTASDATAPVLAGSGTAASPFRVASMPFADVRDTSRAGTRAIDRYACLSTANEGGAEFVYRLDVTAPMRVRAMLFDRGSVDIDLHLLSGRVDPAACVARDNGTIVRDLTPGTWYFVLDTYIGSDGAARAGEYVFVLMQD